MSLTKNKVIKGFAIFFTLYTGIALLAPIFAHLGWEVLSDAIYKVYMFTCHQRPWRSPHLFDHQTAFCARDIFMFGSTAISLWWFYYKDLKPLELKISIFFFLLCLIPIATDGLTQTYAELTVDESTLIPFYESRNITRSMTGVIFGIGFGFFLIPLLTADLTEYGNIKEYLKPVIYALVSGIIFYMALNLVWFYTSDIYKPSNQLFDTSANIPGYNYEIVRPAGHSTIERFLDERDVNKAYERALLNDKLKYIYKYEAQSE